MLIAGFDWPPVLSLGRNLGPFGDNSVSVFVPRSGNYEWLHVFPQGGGWRRGREEVEKQGCRVKKSFRHGTFQFRSCSVPTQIKTFSVAHVNMLPTALRFNEPWYERHLKPMKKKKITVHLKVVCIWQVTGRAEFKAGLGGGGGGGGVRLG